MRESRDLLSIGEAATLIGVSISTLRIWDSSGKLKALRSSGGHRYYSREQLERFVLNIESIARIWTESLTAPKLSPDQYCQTHDIFRARLDTMSIILGQNSAIKNIAPLIVAITGEIGNNS